MVRQRATEEVKGKTANMLSRDPNQHTPLSYSEEENQCHRYYTAILLAIFAYLCVIDILGPTLFLGFRPLIAGFGAGLIVGDVQTGMLIGGTLELMALGVYTYGGATVPDYTVGAILGDLLRQRRQLRAWPHPGHPGGAAPDPGRHPQPVPELRLHSPCRPVC